MIETKSTLTAYEQTLIGILRTLPVERIAQVLDYARYIQSRTLEEDWLEDEETEEEILADEALWDAQFAATQDKLEILAEKLRAEIRAGRTQDMIFTDEGELAPE